MLKRKKEKQILFYIRETFLYWRSENGSQITANIINDIEKNADLLEHYFPEIDWNKVEKKSIHDKLFKEEDSQKRRR